MMNWKETKSGKCKIQRRKPICNSCSNHNRFVPMTNADHIRSFSDEELADFISELNECCLAGAGMVDCSNNTDCIDCKGVVLEWLQSEVEE